MVHKEQGFGNRNNMGDTILNFALVNDFRLVNMFYKGKEHLLTFKSENNRTHRLFFG